MSRKPVPPLVGPGMITRRVRLRASDVVLLKGIIEAHEGIAQVFGEHGGDLVIAAPAGRDEELDALVADLCAELGALTVDEGGDG